MKINFKNLTVQVIIAILLGVVVGAVFPEFGAKLKVLADIFIKMIKMLIAPIIFLTVVIGIGNMGDLKKVGKIGGKALLYFEVVSTIALAIGLLVVHLVQPGKGLDTSAANGSDVSAYTTAAAESEGLIGFIMSIIPDNFFGSLAAGQLLPVLFCAILFGVASASLGEASKPVIKLFEQTSEIFFKIIGMVMKLSPIGAFGAMAYTIGNFGVKSLFNLGLLMVSVYITMFLFIVLILGAIAKYFGFNIFKFIAYIKDEIFLVIGTSSSESALPSMMKKLENYGCSKQVVGLVVPTGYSFNLDGTSIYLSMAAMFIAQAYDVPLSIWQQVMLLGVLMLTSKGAAGVTGSGFITLAATLAAFPMIPVEGIALLIGVDRFMSEARAVTNLIGNGVATVIVAKSENEFDPTGAQNKVSTETSVQNVPVLSKLNTQ
ncbi:dicarboxylate/amino acid:cation symporter [Viridibacillus sp. FSL R5-0477]|uniref:C4-dicarboxylate transporter DctA n=1 Tax=Viridibacillus arenosi FSL R5-213 TaxID=1227360 RepID=W4F0Z3_9BACL|nr:MULTISPECIES: dicarboxylate/amino acid:cation symporter [Viridibacillus]ETT86450.1 C4-dicarboxylate transporter DctA [Viridibacillus arenosi FSL R5-213]OMC84669.1 glutamate/aspartate:proton symporter GltP [Viridibacillus sp. FSL H8-0123]OMC86086.1 glutamate/aspartate:proton symporter GltP [Viridibacillus sp. FSL H7-0596]OMC91715.1 glutamate/aspartate:proton symporter GltP [Viridibacillus arenosi]